MKPMHLSLLAGLLLISWSWSALAEPAHNVLTAHFLPVADGTITIDGHLEEPAWSRAIPLATFFEVFPRNDTTPRAMTVARFLYDRNALYIGIHMDEPDPASLRTQYVERDHVSDGQDYIEVFIDALGSGRGAQFFRTDVRGIETDGHYSEIDESEDDDPDYHWQVATSRDAHGWTAEFRIPFATLQYVDNGFRWRLLVYRGRPRTDSVQDASAPIPRNGNCFVCFFNPVRGLVPPKRHGHGWIKPDVVAHAGAPMHGIQSDFGVTAEWESSGGSTLDMAINPDFSEVEADAIQVTGNARYAQSLPEKRPFFMQSLDLLAAQPQLDRPLQPIYTRDIADPDLGIRYTERATTEDFTALLARDAGGGELLLPGPFQTDQVVQPHESDDFIARYVRNLPDLAIGTVLTDREYLGGGFNRVGGFDANWHPSPSDNVNASALLSSISGGPGEPVDDLQSVQHQDGIAGYAMWTHLGDRWTWDLLAQQIGDAFRADLGFVPSAGFRELKLDLGRRWFDIHAFSELRPTLAAEVVRTLDGNETIVRSIYPGIYLTGPHGLYGTIELHLADSARANFGLPLRDYRFVRADLAARPGSHWPLAELSGDIGEQLDLVTGQVRPGGSLALETDFRPTDRLEFDVRMTRAWLQADARDGAQGSLLLDQQGVQIIAWLHLSEANEFRLQGFHERDASATSDTTHEWATSLLFLHHINWRSAWYVGISRNDDPVPPTQRGWEVLAKWTYSYGE